MRGTEAKFESSTIKMKWRHKRRKLTWKKKIEEAITHWLNACTFSPVCRFISYDSYTLLKFCNFEFSHKFHLLQLLLSIDLCNYSIFFFIFKWIAIFHKCSIKMCVCTLCVKSGVGKFGSHNSQTYEKRKRMMSIFIFMHRRTYIHSCGKVKWMLTLSRLFSKISLIMPMNMAFKWKIQW